MAACRITYTALCGTAADDPSCGLLQLGDCRLLLDCGWSEQCDVGHLGQIERVLGDVHAIVLTHGDIAHAGALAALVARGTLPRHAAIISTPPARALTRLALLELLEHKRACSDFTLFNVDHIELACNPRRWACARFFQLLPLSGAAEGVQAVPYSAGHTLGGAAWRFLHAASGLDVVFATDWCHRRERLLGACLLPELFVRPTALLTDARTVLLPPYDATRRDAELIDVVVSTLRGSDGNVLIPVDTASRLLELVLLLDELWAREKFERVYPLVAISNVGRALVDVAQSSLEYMSDHLVKAFELRRDNRLSLRCARLLSSPAQLTQLPPGRKVVLAGSASLEHGPARQLFLDWASEARNTICFVQRPQAGTLAHAVLHAPAGPPHQAIALQHTRRVPLEGPELEAYLKKREEQGMQDGAGPGPSMLSRATSDLSSPAAGPIARTSSGAALGAGGLQSAMSGGVMLRTSSAHLSTLVRNASGQLVQQWNQGTGGGGGGPASQGGASLLGPTQPGATAAWAAVLMDGFQPPQGAEHPMFPDEDEGPAAEVWDEYGQVVDHAPFQAAAAALAVVTAAPSDAPRPQVPPAKREAGTKLELGAKEEEDEEDDDVGPLWVRRARGGTESGSDAEDEEERPTKLVAERVQLTVTAAIRYFNYDGLADSRFVRKAVADLAPGHLVVLRGSDAARRELADHASRELQGFGTQVYRPESGQAAEAAVPGSHALAASDELLQSFPLHQLGRSGLRGVVVDADVAEPFPAFPDHPRLVPHAARAPAAPGEGGDASMEGDGEGEDEGQGWEGDLFFADGAEGVRLSELKKALADAGIPSSWLGPGALSCGPVIISKAALYAGAGGGGALSASAGHGGWEYAGKGHLVVEGAVSDAADDLLHRVRNVIYQLFGVAV